MGGAVRPGARVAVGFWLLLTPGTAPAGAGLVEGDPWEAGDRLVSDASLPAKPGPRLRLETRSWDSAPGSREDRVEVVVQRRGLGAYVARSRFHSEDGWSVDDSEAGLLLRTQRLRALAGLGQLRLGSLRLLRYVGRIEVQVLDRAVLGARAVLHPEEKNGAPEVVMGGFGAFGPWLGSLELGPGVGEVGIGLGLRLRAGLVWTAGYRASAPTMGLAWRIWILEIRGESTQHPVLGSMARVQLVLGALPA
jgi:hypothetical protein